jgi:hypothetical protein
VTVSGIDLMGASETTLKTRYCAQMMAAACVLAGTARDDFHRRVLDGMGRCLRRRCSR